MLRIHTGTGPDDALSREGGVDDAPSRNSSVVVVDDGDDGSYALFTLNLKLEVAIVGRSSRRYVSQNEEESDSGHEVYDGALWN
jgi:hypothetical protein